MVYGFRYIQVNENGMVTGTCSDPVFVDDVEITIDTVDMEEPEMPTDAIYALYYNEEQGLHYVKIADFEPITPDEPTGETVTWESMAQAITDGVNDV